MANRTCRACGAEFDAIPAQRRFCSRCRPPKAQPAQVGLSALPPVGACVSTDCANLIRGHRKFCSDVCRWRERKRRSSASYARFAERRCSGCGESLAMPVRKGPPPKWCDACRRQRQKPTVDDRVARVCELCGLTFDPVQPRARFCGAECSRMSRLSPTIERSCRQCATAFRSAHPAAAYCSVRCRRDAESRRRRVKPKRSPRSRIFVRDCQACGSAFTARAGSAKRCAECRRVHNIDRIMGLYVTAYETGNLHRAAAWRSQLVEYLRHRDGDRCLHSDCGKRMRFGLRSGPKGDDRAPSIDHVIPRSLGGSDDLANLRLLCWGCNRSRGNRGGGEQLRLVG